MINFGLTDADHELIRGSLYKSLVEAVAQLLAVDQFLLKYSY